MPESVWSPLNNLWTLSQLSTLPGRRQGIAGQPLPYQPPTQPTQQQYQQPIQQPQPQQPAQQPINNTLPIKDAGGWSAYDPSQPIQPTQPEPFKTDAGYGAIDLSGGNQAIAPTPTPTPLISRRTTRPSYDWGSPR